jgi:hypothetical protein
MVVTRETPESIERSSPVGYAQGAGGEPDDVPRLEEHGEPKVTPGEPLSSLVSGVWGRAAERVLHPATAGEW